MLFAGRRMEFLVSVWVRCEWDDELRPLPGDAEPPEEVQRRGEVAALQGLRITMTIHFRK